MNKHSLVPAVQMRGFAGKDNKASEMKGNKWGQQQKNKTKILNGEVF